MFILGRPPAGRETKGDWVRGNVRRLALPLAAVVVLVIAGTAGGALCGLGLRIQRIDTRVHDDCVGCNGALC